MEDLRDFSEKLATHLVDDAKDELDVVLRGFLIAEFYVNDFIEAKLPNGKILSNSNLNFRTKLKIIESFDRGDLFTEYIKQLRDFSEVRNKFIHRLDYKLQKDDIEKLGRSIGLDKYEKAQQSFTDKKELLRIIVMQILANVFMCFSVNEIVNGKATSLSDQAKRQKENDQK